MWGHVALQHIPDLVMTPALHLQPPIFHIRSLANPNNPFSAISPEQFTVLGKHKQQTIIYTPKSERRNYK
jgi:hypothetical protein